MNKGGKPRQKVRYDLTALRAGIASQFTARIAVALTSLVLAILYVRILSASEYAAYATAIAMAGLLVQVTSTGLERLVFRYAPAPAEAGLMALLAKFFRALLAVRLVTILVGTGVTALAWQWLCGIVGLPIDLLHFILIIAVAQTLVAHWLSVSQVLMRQRAIALSVSIASVAKLLLACTLAMYLGRQFSTTQALVVLAVSETLTAIMLGFQHKHFLRNSAAHESEALIDAHMLPSAKEAAHFVLGNYGMTQLSTVIHPRVQILVASAVLPDAAVAGYAFVRNLVEQSANFMPSRAFRQLFEPLLMGRYRDGKNDSEVAISLTLLTKANLFVITPIAILFAVGGPNLLGFVTGGKYVEQSILLALLLYGLVLSTYRTSVGVLINASGNVNITVLAALVGACSVILFLWIPLKTNGVWLLALTELVYTAAFLLLVKARASFNRPGLWAPLQVLASAGILYASVTFAGVYIAGQTGNATSLAIGVGALTVSAGFSLLVTRWLCTCTPQETTKIVATLPGFLAPTVRKFIRQRTS